MTEEYCRCGHLESEHNYSAFLMRLGIAGCKLCECPDNE